MEAFGVSKFFAVEQYFKGCDECGCWEGGREEEELLMSHSGVVVATLMMVVGIGSTW